MEQEPKTVLYISASWDYKNVEYSNMYERMWVEIKRQGIFSAGIEHLALYYDNPYDKIYGELLAKGGIQTRGNYCFEKYVSDPRRTAP